MDPLTLGLLGAQALIGGAQFIGGLAKPRQKIDTSIQPEFKEAESAMQNASQSTSAAYGLARQSLASDAASTRAALIRTSNSPTGLLRAQQMASRGQQSAIASLYQSEVREKAGELRGLASAKMATAGAKERMQGLKNSLVMQENAARDQLISAGMQNIFGALQTGVYAQNSMVGGTTSTTDPFASDFRNTPGFRTRQDLMRRTGR
jgi:hypothetical protein